MADYPMYKVGITVKEPWAQDISYEVLDMTLYSVANGGDGCSYVALKSNIGVTPGTDDTVWLKSTQAGQSIYDLAVKYGHFDGTEEEFEAQYQAVLQAARDAASATNATNEQVMSAEALRVEAEQNRVSAETSRVSAEESRASAEQTRENNELARSNNESGRSVAEQSRATAEQNRVSAENSRVSAENNRANAEVDRRNTFEALEEDMETAIGQADAATAAASAINDQIVSAEESRVAAESGRVSAEESRVTSEQGRATAETGRATAETSRVTAEQSRVSAETSRATAETNRETRANTDHNTATSDHETAASDHTQAASDHTQAASDHTNAAADHTTAAADHTQATADHAVMAGYDTRLGNVESEVSQLGQDLENFSLDVTGGISGAFGTDGYIKRSDGSFILSELFSMFKFSASTGEKVILYAKVDSDVAAIATSSDGVTFTTVVPGLGSTSFRNYEYILPSDAVVAVSFRKNADTKLDVSASVRGEIEKEIADLEQEVDGNSIIKVNAFIGGWDIENTIYSKGSNDKRVGINEFQLDAGDKIKLSDYTKCRMYIGYRTDNGYGSSGAWKTADYTVPVTGIYVVTLEGIPAATVSDVSDLTKYLIVERAVSQIVRNWRGISQLEDDINNIYEKDVKGEYKREFLISATGEHSSANDRITFDTPLPAGLYGITLQAGTTGNSGLYQLSVHYVGASNSIFASFPIGSTQYLTFNSPVDSIGIYMDSDVNQHTGTMPIEIVDLRTSIDANINYLKQVSNSVAIQWEIGNITISNNGWSYSNSSSRVRLKAGTVIRLKYGDIVGLSSYTDARFYIGWKKPDGTYGHGGNWKTSDYVVQYDADYVVVLSNINETTQTSADALASLFRIKGNLVTRKTFVGGVPGINHPYIDYDTSLQQVTIPKDIVIIDGDNIFAPNTTAPVTISIASVSSSAIKIIYDKSDGTFKAVPFNTLASFEYRLVIATVRRKGPGVSGFAVSSIYPWSVDGYPYGIKTEPVRGLTKGVNHRGYNGDYPENTLPAFVGSAKKGFKAVECDVEFTSDDVPVILHDSTINRTARNEDGSAIESTINIADITYEQALQYDFGIWKGDAFAGTKIPTLVQFIALCRNLGLHPYIELKVGTQAKIEACVDIVKQYGMLRDCTWISFNSSLLGYVKGRDPKARLGYLVSAISSSSITTAEALKNDDNEVFLDSSAYAAGDIALCKAASIPLEIWTVDIENTIKALDPYISGVTSDSQDASRILYDNSIA